MNVGLTENTIQSTTATQEADNLATAENIINNPDAFLPTVEAELAVA